MTSNLLMALGPYEIVLILLVVVLLFGGKKIPELAKGLGKGIREFNSAKASIEEEIKDGMKVDLKETKKVRSNKD